MRRSALSVFILTGPQDVDIVTGKPQSAAILKPLRLSPVMADALLGPDTVSRYLGPYQVRESSKKTPKDKTPAWSMT
jgi:hypothetical protein